MAFDDVLPELDTDMLAKAMDRASRLGAAYADVRLEATHTESAEAENGDIKRLDIATGTSLGVRALAGGAWGFSSTDVPEPRALRSRLVRATERAVRQARAISRFGEVALAPTRPVVKDFPLRVKREPWPAEEKKDLIADITRRMRAVEGTAVAIGELDHTLFDWHFASTEGARISRRWLLTSGEFLVQAVGPGGSQMWWRPFGVAGGLELLRGERDPERIGLELARKVVALTREAKVPESGKTTVITTPEFDQLLVHEVMGHPSEGDRVLGGESAWAGRAWWSDKVGTRVGSELVTAVSDARPTPRHAGGYGTFPYDDEGVPAKRVVNVERGVLKEFLHSRQTAAVVGVAPNGAMRAVAASDVPIIRMTNTYFESDPEGPSTLEECIEDVRDGVILGWSSIPSIDSIRLRFQINAYEGWRVRNGEVVGLLKNIALLGSTPDFFKTIRLVGNERTWHLHSLPNCGKGDPMQIARVGNGGPVMVGEGMVVGVA